MRRNDGNWVVMKAHDHHHDGVLHRLHYEREIKCYGRASCRQSVAAPLR